MENEMNAALDQLQEKATTDTFVAAMRNTVNGVAIVASQGTAGRAGITVSSMVSVSAEPPMLLVCINRSSPTHNVICANGRFSINVLGVQQRALADRFAGRGDRPYWFDHREWTFDALPMLAESAALYDCDLHDAIAAGTHTILVGRVRFSVPGDLEPLCYSDRNYARTAALDRLGTKSVLESGRFRPRLTTIDNQNGRTQ
jgi:flavin reductase (DIM6/NTAB) family NADH-FMN oxidoreductase RutF